MAKSLPEYPSFTPADSPKDAANWADWLEGFQAMLDAMQIPEDGPAVVDADHPENNRAARVERYNLFWHYIGTDCRKRLKKCDENGIATSDYTAAHKALTAKFNPTLNRLYQMHVVHSMRQAESESMDNFYVRVKDEVNKMCLSELNVQQLIELIILSQLVNNTHNQHLTRKAINNNHSLQEFREHARTTELTDQQLQGMKTQTETTNFVKKTKQQHDKRRKGKKTHDKDFEKKATKVCDYCGESCPKGKCPAFGKICSICGKRNHLPKMCKTAKYMRKKDKTVHQLEDEADTLD